MSELREQLSDIEPDDSTYEGIGASEVAFLRQLLDDQAAWLAARAAHALSRIDTESAHAALIAASQSSRPEVRIAVAASAGALPPRVSDEVLSVLLDDSEIGVRKFAIKSASDHNSERIKQRLVELASTETYTALRHVAEEKARSLPPR
jgi:HEAT repeat protein